MAKLNLPTEITPEVVHELKTKLGLKTSAGEIALRYALIQVVLLDMKQCDYGPRNISDFGTPGVIIRMNDKMQRLKTLAGNKRRKARNESIKDSFQDISNYGIIGQMVEDNVWPNV